MGFSFHADYVSLGFLESLESRGHDLAVVSRSIAEEIGNSDRPETRDLSFSRAKVCWNNWGDARPATFI